MRDLAFIIMFVPMLLPAMRHIHVGAMLWIWTALAGPGQYFYGLATIIPLNKIAVASTLVAMFTDRGRRKPVFDAHVVVLMLFVLQGVVSFSFGLTDTPRSYDLLDKMTKIAALCLIMTMASRGRLQTHATVVVLCLSLGTTGVLDGLKFIASAGAHKVLDSPTLGDNNYVALAGLMVLPLLLYLNRYSGLRMMRVMFLVAFIAIFFGVVATASRGGLIGLIVLGLLIVAQSKRKLPGLLLIGALAGGLVLLAPPQWTERMETIKSADDDSSFMSRVISWKMHTLLALDRPLLGGGYSALEDPRVHAAYTPNFQMLDFIPTDEPTVAHAAHSIYFQALGDLGFGGLLLFLCLLAIGYRNVGDVRRRTRGDPARAWAYDLAGTFRMVLVVFMVSGAALSATYFEAFYVMLTAISILRRHVEEEATARSGTRFAAAATAGVVHAAA